MDGRFDLIVIGTGPAGQRASVQAARLGRSVLAVEKGGKLGGVCVHSGTIPGKALREAVLVYAGLRSHRLHGVGVAVRGSLSVKDLVAHAAGIVDTETAIVRDQLARNGVTLEYGTARLTGPREIRVDSADGSRCFEAGKIIIAVGAVPVRSPHIPFDGTHALDTESVLSLERMPGRMVIVGAGIIGVEYACMFASLGVTFDLTDRRCELLRFLDREIVEALAWHMFTSGIRLRLGEDVQEVSRGTDGLRVRLTEEVTITCDTVLYVQGRVAATSDLGLEHAAELLREGGPVRLGTCPLSGDRARAAGRRLGRTPQAAVPSRHTPSARCPCHRKRRHGADPYRAGRHVPRGVHRVLREQRVQLPDFRRVLPGRRARRDQQAPFSAATRPGGDTGRGTGAPSPPARGRTAGSAAGAGVRGVTPARRSSDFKRSLVVILPLLIALVAAFAEAAVPAATPESDFASLVTAERAFASSAATEGLRAAFLEYLAETSIVFAPGPTDGRKRYEAIKPGPALLSWEPVHAEVSAAGDLGYTTGPWEFRRNGAGGDPDARGDYVSVWRRQDDGSWRVVLDVGTSREVPALSEGPIDLAPEGRETIEGPQPAEELPDARESLRKAEADATASARSDGAATLLELAMPSIRVYREGSVPLIGVPAAREALATERGARLWTPSGVEVARSGDLGVTWGSTGPAGAPEQAGGNPVPPVATGSYVRIWRRSPGGTWRLVLDLLTPSPSSEE